MILAMLIVGAIATAGKCDDPCQLAPDSGSCSSSDPTAPISTSLRYYYSSLNLQCSEMPYSGCGGNANNFKTLEECKEKCGKKPHEAPMVAAIREAGLNGKCWYGNRTYKVGSQIPETSAESPCNVGCFCADGYPKGSPPQITCGVVDCFQPWPEPEPGHTCVIVEKGKPQCCSDHYCGSASKPPPFQCRYKEQNYFEDQVIYPNELPCFTCHCNKKSWTGGWTTEGRVCRELSCGLAVHYQKQLVDGCEPEYFTTKDGRQLCCPIGWKCGDDNNKGQRNSKHRKGV